MVNDLTRARVQDGTLYEGNQMFKGCGVVRWCAICGKHREQLGGRIKHVLGGRHWVCAKHGSKTNA